MGDSNWRVPRMQAFAYLRDLERPPSISPRQWVGVKAFLYVVARGQPKMYWGQEKIAKHMGVTDRSVRRYITLACDAGLLTVWINAGTGRRGSPSKTSQYHLTELLVVPDKLSAAVPEQLSGKGSAEPDGSPDQATRDTPCPGLRPEHSVSAAASAAAASNLDGMPKTPEDVPGFQKVKDAPRINRRPAAKDPDAARRLVNYFKNQWYEVVVQEIPRFQYVRDIESLKAGMNYVNATWLRPEAGRVYTEDEVRQYIDQFVEAVYRHTVVIKPNQSAWQRFVGWWGRAEKVYRHDPGANRRFFEEEQRRLLTQDRPPA